MHKVIKFDQNKGLLFVAPAVLTIMLVVIYPLFYTFILSFIRSDIFSNTFKYVGISQYIKLLKDPVFILSIKNTFLWTFNSVLFQFILGFIAAVLINQDFIKAKALLRILLLVPWVLPSIVGVMVWKWMFHADFGIINVFLKWLGIISQNISWVSEEKTALASAIIVNVWKMFPFVMIMIDAALQNVPNDLKDAAKIDGANDLRVFMTVTVPHIALACLTVILLLTIWAFNAFTFIFVLTEGGPAHRSETLPMFIYKSAFRNYNFGIASSASIVLLILVAIFSIIYIKIFLRRED